MAGAFAAVDLAKLPVPAAVEQIDYEVILAQMLQDLIQRDPGFSALVESDPAYKILQVAAYRETLLRQQSNDKVHSIMLAYAEGSDLEQIAARFNVERLVLSPADDTTVPPTPAVMEDDESLRRRVQLAFEGTSTAGPKGAYIFHTLGADGRVADANADTPRFTRVTDLPPDTLALLPADAIVLACDYDAGLTDPMPGDVAVVVQSNEDTGEASQEVIDAVTETLSADDVRPLTDTPRVRSAQVINYSIEATLTFFSGPDMNVAMQAAEDAIAAYTASQHKLGLDVTLSGIYAALHQPGVQNVQLSSPAANIVVPWDSVAYCTSVTLHNGGTDE